MPYYWPTCASFFLCALMWIVFDGFYDQTKAEKVISCVKLMSNPKSIFLEFLSVENVYSIFAIFS